MKSLTKWCSRFKQNRPRWIRSPATANSPPPNAVSSNWVKVEFPLSSSASTVMACGSW